MKHRYICDGCGAYLDPGEGMLCDECREKLQKKIKSRETFNRLLCADHGQLEMRMEELR